MSGTCRSLDARKGLSPGLGEHEWDFRADCGSKMSGSLVAMEIASGRAGEGAA
jgi:hypothetical protein